MLAAAIACGDQKFATGVQVFVQGVVTSPTGTPVGGARVLIEIFQAADGRRLGEEPTLANAQGRYGILLAVLGNARVDGTLNVQVEGEQAGVALEGLVEGIPFSFKNPETGIDTVNVDVTLEESSP